MLLLKRVRGVKETTGNFFEIIEFEWDAGNRDKSLLKHGVSNEEAEDAFFDPDGKARKTKADRYIHLGVTSSGRYLIQIFEFRSKNTVRIISSRPMDEREKKMYRTK